MSKFLIGTSKRDDIFSLNIHGIIGVLATIGLAGGFVFWAANTEIAGAVAAHGTIIVDSFAKKVQHQEGGIVKAFYVRDGDVVTEGQLLAELDDTAISANLAVLTTQIREAEIRESRLNAELDGTADFELPPSLDLLVDDPEVLRLAAVERRVLKVRRGARDSRVAQLNEQVVQLERQIEGLSIQMTAVEERLTILKQELETAEGLFAKQLLESVRVTALRKDLADLSGQRGRLVASVAETRAAIAERKLQATQIDQDFLSQVLDDLQETRRALFDGLQRARTEDERLQRTKLRSPQTGVVHESIIHTVGGVVAPGDTLMMIVPQNDKLLVSVRIIPTDIEKVTIGQVASLRLTGLSQRTTPELPAKIETIAPDLTQDRVTGAQYFSARILIDEGALELLPPDVKLVPGMPVAAFIKTVDRTVLGYLVQPFQEELDYALRED